MDAFFGKWKEFERTLGVTFYGELKEDSGLREGAQVPRLASTRALDANKMPRRRVRRADQGDQREPADAAPLLPAARRRCSACTEMRYYDIYPPLVGGGREYPIDEGIRIMLESAAAARRRSTSRRCSKGLEDRWMDVYPRPKKLSGRAHGGRGVRRAPVRAA